MRASFMTQNIFYNVDLKISSHNSVLCVVKISNLLLNKKKNFLKEGNFIIIWKNYKFNFFLRMLSLSSVHSQGRKSFQKRNEKNLLIHEFFFALRKCRTLLNFQRNNAFQSFNGKFSRHENDRKVFVLSRRCCCQGVA